MSGDRVLAADHLYFGEGNSGEWKQYGFNIDGLVSTATSMDLCQPNSGGASNIVYPDGDNGNDNSFGKNILPLLLGIYPTMISQINDSLLNGKFTMMLKMNCLPTMDNVDPLKTELFQGTALGMVPKFDGTDQWPVAPELLSNPMVPTSSKIVYPQSSVTGTMFDAGKNVEVVLTIPMSTATSTAWITLNIHAARMTMMLSADRKSATNGRIGGVLRTEEFVTEFKKVGALFGLCGNPLYTNLNENFRQASDILADGSQDPTATCDGISIGLGFDMKEVQLGVVGPMAPMQAACQ